MEPEAETDRIVTRMFLNQAMNEASDPYFGRVNWAIIHREKLVQITFPLPGKKQLQITTALGYPVSKVAKLGKYVNQLGNGSNRGPRARSFPSLATDQRI